MSADANIILKYRDAVKRNDARQVRLILRNSDLLVEHALDECVFAHRVALARIVKEEREIPRKLSGEELVYCIHDECGAQESAVLRTVMFLVEELQANVNAKEIFTPLSKAAACNYPRVASYLLEHGAKMPDDNPRLRSLTNAYVAARANGHVKVLDVLEQWKYRRQYRP